MKLNKEWRRALKMIRAREEANPVTAEEISAAEQALGQRLPGSYREFCQAMGAVVWPVCIDDPQGVVGQAEEERSSPGYPDYLLFFGSDGGEMRYAFDTRCLLDDEYPVVTVCLEERFVEAAAPTSAEGGFAAWLVDCVDDAVAAEQASAPQDLVDTLDALLQPEVRVPRAWCPEPEDVEAAAQRLGVKLSRDYRGFSAAFGPVEWPLEIVDATGIEELRGRIEADGTRLPDGFVPFGRDASGIHGFHANKRSVVVFTPEGRLEKVATSFLAWLQARVAARRALG